MAKRVSATVAKNQLGQILRMAETEPVYIVKHGKPQTVVMAPSLRSARHAGPRAEDQALAALRAEFERM